MDFFYVLRIFVVPKIHSSFCFGDAYVFTDVRDHGWAQGIVRNENLSVDL